MDTMHCFLTYLKVEDRTRDLSHKLRKKPHRPTRNKVTKAGADYMSIKDHEDIEQYDEKQGYLHCFS